GSSYFDFRFVLGNPPKNIKDLVVEMGGALYVNPRYGINLRLEQDGAVVLIDPERIPEGYDHAGRSGMIFATNDRTARHELTELRMLAQWWVDQPARINARQERIVAIWQGKLGW